MGENVVTAAPDPVTARWGHHGQPWARVNCQGQETDHLRPGGLKTLWVPEIVSSTLSWGFLFWGGLGELPRAASCGSGTVSSSDFPPALPDPHPAVWLAGPAAAL